MSTAEALHDSVANLVTALVVASDNLAGVTDPAAATARAAIASAFKDVVALRGKIHALHNAEMARAQAVGFSAASAASAQCAPAPAQYAPTPAHYTPTPAHYTPAPVAPVARQVSLADPSPLAPLDWQAELARRHMPSAPAVARPVQAPCPRPSYAAHNVANPAWMGRVA
jgi:hypothetical protein